MTAYVVDDLRVSLALRAVSLADLPDEPFTLSGIVAFGSVHDDPTAEAALFALARGVDVVMVVDLPPRRRAVFLDDVTRIARIQRNHAPSPALTALTPEERAVLEGLARGGTLTQVAAALGMSRRTATRRLTSAKVALGVATTVEALVAISHVP